MSTADDGLEARVNRLEQELSQVKEVTAQASADASAARVLASGADHDVSEVRAELRAHVSALHALRETQLEHGQAIVELRGELHSGFAELRRDLTDTRADMRQGFATLHAGMTQIVALLTDAQERPE